jgi:hypothetical protein
MCDNSNIHRPLHPPPPVAAAGAASGWLRGLGHFTESAYFDTNPGEEGHLALLRWYTGAIPKAHMRIILEAGNQLPVLHHWLQRSLQL